MRSLWQSLAYRGRGRSCASRVGCFALGLWTSGRFLRSFLPKLAKGCAWGAGGTERAGAGLLGMDGGGGSPSSDPVATARLDLAGLRLCCCVTWGEKVQNVTGIACAGHVFASRLAQHVFYIILESVCLKPWLFSFFFFLLKQTWDCWFLNYPAALKRECQHFSLGFSGLNSYLCLH